MRLLGSYTSNTYVFYGTNVSIKDSILEINDNNLARLVLFNVSSINISGEFKIKHVNKDDVWDNNATKYRTRFDLKILELLLRTYNKIMSLLNTM